MGFGAVAAGAIMLMLTLITVAILGSVLYAVMMNMAKEVLGEHSYLETVTFKITSIAYNSTLNELLINISNIGREPIIPYVNTEIIVDYIDESGSRKIDVLHYREWSFNRLIIGNSSYNISSGVFVEIPPGAILEIKTSPTSLIDTSQPIIVIVVLDNGVKSEYISNIK
ncbi:MAG: hypothetical protein B6U76_06350 [Desulfurococcales archaeon ex4484_217_2]|nr:MAG: hypothetical protein B6U76_06350 [Desulfurococcales archaeon ex4484_217_2]